MRVSSVARMKSRTTNPTRPFPREGTHVRKVWDMFQDNRGRIIQWSLTSSKDRQALNSLQDYYGLDIRNMGYRHWCLAGEWCGKVYVDYIAQERKEAWNVE